MRIVYLQCFVIMYKQKSSCITITTEYMKLAYFYLDNVHVTFISCNIKWNFSFFEYKVFDTDILRTDILQCDRISEIEVFFFFFLREGMFISLINLYADFFVNFLYIYPPIKIMYKICELM